MLVVELSGSKIASDDQNELASPTYILTVGPSGTVSATLTVQ